MCRDGQPVTAELAAEVASRLVGYLGKAGKTQAWAAGAMGMRRRGAGGGGGRGVRGGA